MSSSIPSVVHPKRFTIKGIYFEVVSFDPLTDPQAARLVQTFYRSHRFTRKDQGKVFRVVTIADQSHAGLL
jgi:hypothetical protein